MIACCTCNSFCRMLAYGRLPRHGKQQVPSTLTSQQMPTIRLSTKEIQVDDTIYVFDVVQVADKFEACVAAADAEHCEIEHPPVTKRAVTPPAPTAQEVDEA